MSSISKLRNLPLSHLFSGPLLAAIDASVQAQTETIDLLRNAGYTEEGELATVGFSYPTPQVDPDTGEEREVVKQLEIPLLLFLSLPNLVVSEIEEEFTAQITDVDEPEESTASTPATTPSRLQVSPSSQSATPKGRTRSKFDLSVRMVAEVENRSTGIDLLERAANNATRERVVEERGPEVAESRPRPTISAERTRSLREESETSEE